MDCHCVLTRCGFLHWFAGSPPDPADIVPADSLNLSRSAGQSQTSLTDPAHYANLSPNTRDRLKLTCRSCCTCTESPLLRACRCQFETGEAQAQEFNLIELAAGVFGRSRRLIFKASSMEECCEWAIVLREAIAESSRK